MTKFHSFDYYYLHEETENTQLNNLEFQSLKSWNVWQRHISKLASPKSIQTNLNSYPLAGPWLSEPKSFPLPLFPHKFRKPQKVLKDSTNQVDNSQSAREIHIVLPVDFIHYFRQQLTEYMCGLAPLIINKREATLSVTKVQTSTSPRTTALSIDNR